MRASLLSLLFLLLAPTFAVGVGLTNPDLAWKHYLESDTGLEPRLRFPHASCFRASAARYRLPETLLLAVARGESDFEPTARSKANAHGVMQILWPTTARHLGIHRLSDLYDPCTNIDAGARYLKEMLNRFDGNLHLALAAYNYGPERIDANRDRIPAGAEWYSAYIFRHLGYVIGDSGVRASGSRSLYSELGHSTLVEFAEPYRAAAFVERLESRAPEVQLDWFRKGVGRFSVVMTYADKKEFDEHAGQLGRAGFPLQ
jgi:hypothetical protein